MRRLWVRISKCSRLSLYLCGERMPAVRDPSPPLPALPSPSATPSRRRR
jgi:hypothetical protein